MPIVEANPLTLCLQNLKHRVTIKIFDDTEDQNPIDPVELDLSVQTLDGTVVYTDSYTTPPVVGTRIVKTAVGVYYLLWGDPTAPANIPTQTESATHQKYLFVWSIVNVLGGEEEQIVQTLEVIPAGLMEMIREFRDQIDKMVKRVDVSAESFCPLGYTDGMLLEYLRGGMTLINAYQPYPTWCSLEQFPLCFQQTLFDAALVVGVNAQALFAVDADLENYSDQGNALVINHQPKLMQFTTNMTQRLDKIIPMMKLHFVRSGSVKTEVGANFRLATLVQMSPNGATFRNVFTR